MSLSLIHPDDIAKIYEFEKIELIPFDFKHKEIIMTAVVDKDSNLRTNYSYEGGFTKDWDVNFKNKMIKYYEDNNFEMKKDLLNNYHNHVRDFRFVIENDQIVGLRTKDSLIYWTEEEAFSFKELINDCVNEFKNPEISMKNKKPRF